MTRDQAYEIAKDTCERRFDQLQEELADGRFQFEDDFYGILNAEIIE